MSEIRKQKTLVRIEELGPVPEGKPDFLTHVRKMYRNHYTDGSTSRPYAYEHFHRRGYDAVAIGLHFERGGEPWLSCRQGIRIPAYFRQHLDLGIKDQRVYLNIPEAVAGSIEPQDIGLEGLLHRIAAEALEEAGFSIEPEQIEPLGGGFFPSHGQSSEKIHLCAVRVDPASRGVASGDGSVNEADAPPVEFRPVREIILDCCRGQIEDPKIETLAWRLSIKLGYSLLLGRSFSAEEIELVRDFQDALASCGPLGNRGNAT